MAPRDVTTEQQLAKLACSVQRIAAGSGGRGGTDALERLLAVLGLQDRLAALTVDLADEVLESQVCAKREGLDTEQVLRTVGRRTRTDARTLVSLAETLRAMPSTAGLFREGRLSWGEVRSIGSEARRLNADDRGWLDRRIASDIDRLEALGADGVVDAVQRAVSERRPQDLRRRERRGHEGRFVNLSPFLDGSGGSIYGELDAEGLATVAEATEVAGRRAGCPADQHDPEATGVVGRGVGQRRADGLVHLADNYLAGGATDAPAKPQFVLLADAQVLAGLPTPVHVPGTEVMPELDLEGAQAARATSSALTDLLIDAGIDGTVDDAAELLTALWRRGRTDDALHGARDGGDHVPVGSRPAGGDPFGGGAGLLLWRTPRGPIVLSRAAVERLACDASYRIVLRDRGRIIGVTSTKDAVDRDLRAAVIARDGHCRFPGCRRPPAHCHAHHVTYRRHGGETGLSNLVLLCDHHHRVVHDRGWHVDLGDDGTVIFRRRRRRFTTLPHQRRCLPTRDAPPCHEPVLHRRRTPGIDRDSEVERRRRPRRTRERRSPDDQWSCRPRAGRAAGDRRPALLIAHGYAGYRSRRVADRELPREVRRCRLDVGSDDEERPNVRRRASSGSPYEAEYGFSRAIRVGDRVLVAGTAPIWPDGSCDPDVDEQARRCLEIIAAALSDLGAEVSHVVRTRMFITDTADSGAVGAVHGEFFGEVRPVATMVVVDGLLDPRWRVEIEAEAIVTSS